MVLAVLGRDLGYHRSVEWVLGGSIEMAGRQREGAKAGATAVLTSPNKKARTPGLSTL